MNNAFDTGIRFWYHAFYKSIDREIIIKNDQSIPAKENDFGGYSVSDLYVSPHYNSLKEEVLNCECNIDIKQFNKFIVEKGNEYIETETCKKIKCKESRDELHFGIYYESHLCISHLLALIPFIDFKEFSIKFASTFGRIKQNENIQSIKKRNSKFHHTAKKLMELVQCFGIDGGWKGEHGPFYIATSNVLNLASFAMRINKPILATKDINVAKQLSISNGMIIEINNNEYPGHYETFFDCSWISNNTNDQQRIFFGGRYKLKVENVTIMKMEKNYNEIMSAYYKFDAMISGYSIRDDIKNEDIDIIDSSINYILGDSSSNNTKLDNYTLNSFYAFTMEKTQIVLNLYELHQIKNVSLVEFIMHSIQKQQFKEIGNNDNNLFKQRIFGLFPNLCEIIIYLSSWNGNVYSFNLLSLLSTLVDEYKYKVLAFGYLREYEQIYNILIPSNIKQMIKRYHIYDGFNSFKRIIIKDQYPKQSDFCLTQVFDHEIFNAFKTEKINIELRRNRGSDNKQDWMIISL